jgi:restriction system protein
MPKAERLNYFLGKEILDMHTTSWCIPSWIKRLAWCEICPYCNTSLNVTYSGFKEDNNGETWGLSRHDCEACGWWRTNKWPDHYFLGYCKIGILHTTSMNLTDSIYQGLGKLDDELALIQPLSPVQFEKAVASILGTYYDCDVVHVGRSNDGGIDLILLNSNLGFIPVQVKKRQTRKSESVRLIREFRGAMLLKGVDKGVIVTTASKFSNQAVDASCPRAEHLVQQTIDLIDARRLLEIIKVIGCDKVAQSGERFIPLYRYSCTEPPSFPAQIPEYGPLYPAFESSNTD